jgi:D-alanine-D-alanine ligase
MIIKDILQKQNLLKGKIPKLSKNNIFSIKVDKSIEILIVPNPGEKNSHQDNVGIILEEDKILKILCKRYKRVSIIVIKKKKDLEKLVKRKPDLVFSGVKYFEFNEKKIWLNDYLEKYKIPYIASGRSALENESDKNRAKKIMRVAKVKTADFFITIPNEYQNLKSIPIPFPLFIKPIRGGDSRGIDSNSIVYNFTDFKKKVLYIKKNYNLASLVETYLSGKEYSVGIFEDTANGYLRALPVEIIIKKNVNGHCILDFDIKKNDEEKVVAVKDIKIFNKISKLAKDSFKALGGKSLGRIDIKMNDCGVPHFMEANLMPGLRRGYFYRSCVLNLDMNYEDMIFNIANTGLSSNSNIKN